MVSNTKEEIAIELSKRCNIYADIVEILTEKLIEFGRREPEFFGEVVDLFQTVLEPKLDEINKSIEKLENEK